MQILSAHSFEFRYDGFSHAVLEDLSTTHAIASHNFVSVLSEQSLSGCRGWWLAGT